MGFRGIGSGAVGHGMIMGGNAAGGKCQLFSGSVLRKPKAAEGCRSPRPGGETEGSEQAQGWFVTKRQPKAAEGCRSPRPGGETERSAAGGDGCEFGFGDVIGMGFAIAVAIAVFAGVSGVGAGAGEDLFVSG